MKKTIVLLVATVALSSAFAQERLERKEALKYAFYLSMDLKSLQGTPIPTDVDTKYPVAMRLENYGAMVLPETKLQASAIGNAGQSPVALGQLWFNNLAPMKDGEGVSRTDLRVVEVKAENQDPVPVFQCALAAKSTASGQLELLIYGKSKTPVAQVPLKKVEASQDYPIEMSATRGDEQGTLTLRILGKYEAAIPVTEPGY